MALIHSEKSALKLSRNSLFIFVGVVIIGMASVLLFSLNTPSFIAMRQLYDFYPSDRSLTTNNFVPDIERSINSSTVMIKTLNTGSYTFASAKLPSKIVSGKAVGFILDIENPYSSVNSLEITITGDKGQYLLFLPYSQNEDKKGRVEFHYIFPEPGTYNVDIAFGAPKGVNFNILVAPEEATV